MKFGNLEIHAGDIVHVEGNIYRGRVRVEQVCASEARLRSDQFTDRKWFNRFKKRTNRPYPQFYARTMDGADTGKLIHYSIDDIGKVSDPQGKPAEARSHSKPRVYTYTWGDSKQDWEDAMESKAKVPDCEMRIDITGTKVRPLDDPYRLVHISTRI